MLIEMKTIILHFIYVTESASELVEGRYGHSDSKLIYGTFTTPTNAIPGSAVCAFSLQVSNQNKRKKK